MGCVSRAFRGSKTDGRNRMAVDLTFGTFEILALRHMTMMISGAVFNFTSRYLVVSTVRITCHVDSIAICFRSALKRLSILGLGETWLGVEKRESDWPVRGRGGGGTE